MRERVSVFQTAARSNFLNCGKSPVSRSKQKKADVEPKMKQACVELEARNALVAELEARAAELEKQPEHNALQMCVAELKCFLFQKRL